MNDAALIRIRQRLLESMVEFMEVDEEEPDPEFDCGYTQADIDRCAEIVDKYLQTIANQDARDQAAILLVIQQTVERLNKLNESCDGRLIETDQREDLCELILTAAKMHGLQSDEDVTEPWRQW